mmetsp:Transcript_9143/g.16672  ORF Transcript_9143/g.16672 Transcript_9143/m.16672 type:complete len:556 (-) Transcript_9143:134-1801(-)|eukprot:CAMPEP_0205904358 /NCGR_PEP_ID=MMETSP1325-20131115/671_1 /ASSEMBLY_ACC=CAM_ASM_000708 /TAXON_ID=236786 /ORGANISM="Florenciella sp., Strain RCC1007" /LENGTH=555 /DNA_ID=CAMNT_0053270127 /DNA_START=93 /DNA_END=1760 /DNA_ORIENTATION=+
MAAQAQTNAWFILAGGEAASLQGGPYATREFVHTSCALVGEAYAALRAAGVPAERIITICQLKDYIEYLRAGSAEAIPSQEVPGFYYKEQLERTCASCNLWLEESGGKADYDCHDVNPATFIHVLTGDGGGGDGGKVVPADAGAVFFGVYSHGDSHHAAGHAGGAGSTREPHSYSTAEWYIHFPYPAPQASDDASDMYAFVATDGQKSHRTRLYATQIRLALHSLASTHNKRPVVGLLNCCRSGGLVEFMRRPSAVQPDLPLSLMFSSGLDTDSLVSGFWSAWFNELRHVALRGGQPAAKSVTLCRLFASAERRYHRENKYEALNHLKEAAFSIEVWQSEFEFTGARAGNVDPWHLDLTAALTAAWEAGHDDDGAEEAASVPDWTALRDLQKAYITGRAYRVTTRPSACRPTYLAPSGERVSFEGAAQLDDGRWILWMRSNQALTERHLEKRQRLSQPPTSEPDTNNNLAKVGLLFDELTPGLATRPFPVTITAWKGPRVGEPVDLVEAVKRIYDEMIAIPGEAHNEMIEGMSVHEIFGVGVEGEGACVNQSATI